MPWQIVACIDAYAHLLDVGGKLGKGLGVGQDSEGGVPQESSVPNTQHTQQHRNVVLKRRCPEVLVYIVCTCFEQTEIRVVDKIMCAPCSHAQKWRLEHSGTNCIGRKLPWEGHVLPGNA